jgi:hypothetical protein
MLLSTERKHVQGYVSSHMRALHESVADVRTIGKVLAYNSILLCTTSCVFSKQACEVQVIEV